MSKLTDICPDFPEWPRRWMGTEKDLEYGKQLLEAMRPFAASLVESGLSKKTVRMHLTNLWLLGGEVIRNVSFYDTYATPAAEKLRHVVGPDGGPYCRHLDSEAEAKAFDSTCRKLHKFFERRASTTLNTRKP
jgi:hypothetical protein